VRATLWFMSPIAAPTVGLTLTLPLGLHMFSVERAGWTPWRTSCRKADIGIITASGLPPSARVVSRGDMTVSFEATGGASDFCLTNGFKLD
jgi:hypothetical protein